MLSKGCLGVSTSCGSCGQGCTTLRACWCGASQDTKELVTISNHQVRIWEQLLHRSVQQFRGGLVLEAHRLLYHCELDNTYFTDICSGSEAGSYVRCIDVVFHSTLGLEVIKKKKCCPKVASGFRRVVPTQPRGVCWCGASQDTKELFTVSNHQVRIWEQLLHINVQQFRGGLLFDAHRLLYHCGFDNT